MQLWGEKSMKSVYWMWWDYQNFEMDSLLKINLNNQIQAYLWKYSDASSK